MRANRDARSVVGSPAGGIGAGTAGMVPRCLWTVCGPCYRRVMAMSTGRAAPRLSSAEAPDPESVRLAFARAWGEMGQAWGVQPSVAMVHGYLLVHGGVLTERELREALDLSHRATSLALGEIEGWGLVERVPAPRPSRRGPS